MTTENDSIPSASPPPRGRFWLWMLLLGVSLAILALVYILFVEAPPPKKIVISTGGQDGQYYRNAQRYAEYLLKDGIVLEVRASKGSVENLELLNDPASDVSVALVQSGIADPKKCEELFSLGSLYREPLWIFRREPSKTGQLNELTGKKVAIGPEGSGTRGIALQLLAANGLDGSKVNFDPATGTTAASLLLKGEVDAAFFVGSVDAVYIRQLMKAPEVHLMELSQLNAYVHRFPFLSTVTIPVGLIDFSTNTPAKEVHLAAPTATLVARKSIHPALVSLLVAAVTKVHGSGDLLSNPGEFPSKLYNDLPVSEDAEHFMKNGPPFLQRVLPFWLAAFVDRMKLMAIPLFMILMPLFRAAPPLMKWRTRRKIYRWYAELRKIDLKMDSVMSAAEAQRCLHRLNLLEQQVVYVEIPLSYMEEYYNLRLHLNLVHQKIREILHQPGQETREGTGEPLAS